MLSTQLPDMHRNEVHTVNIKRIPPLNIALDILKTSENLAKKELMDKKQLHKKPIIFSSYCY